MYRLGIKESTSYVFPMHSMGAHVSASPNHQTGRTTSLETRFAVAMFGAFGYELNLCGLSVEEKEKIKNRLVDTRNFEIYHSKDPFIDFALVGHPDIRLG